MLKGKKILIGVCGSIAAYKTAFLIRLLKKSGAEVRVIMTPAALDFITPLTLATLSGNPVLHKSFDRETGAWESHIELGLWADLMLIAPASANTMARMAAGQCDNLLLATYLSARCPVFIAPAMDLDMYRHPATVSAMDRLVSYGNTILRAEHGELASGLVGEGRMAEPEHILGILEDHFKKKTELEGKKVLITAGPTLENIDPVRFISNHSSGRMGMALAREAASRGAQVFLVHGPVSVPVPVHPAISPERVNSAMEMFEACRKIHPETDLSIFAAAVSDYAPRHPAAGKIRKKEDSLNLELVRNPDIAAELGNKKKKHQVHIGFALETDEGMKHAGNKLREKNLDFIVLNSLKDEGAGFGHDTNRITILEKDNQSKKYPLKSKEEVASDIFDHLMSL